MTFKERFYKCGVCGVENKYIVYTSDFISGYSDFDMKPVGSIIGLGASIMECPNCHYANYDIRTTIVSELSNNLKLWNSLSEFQNIIKKYSGTLRKILLVAKQYENNMDYLNAYKTYIMASWVSDDKKTNKFRKKAYQIFTEKILPNYNNNLIQIGDILRMEGNFKNAIKIINAVRELTDKSDHNILKVLDAEIKFIENKDKKRHNLGEIFSEK
ncbi:MAG: hypothetical protein IJ223_04905 [Clostridia bacterium]|nr:hypothetical protein [Clostridia bacterium]